MTEHIVSAYTDELEALSADILRMGGLAEAMTGDACEATVKSDDTLATMVVARDADVDALEADIERRIIEIIARRQPLARDLREVLSALKIANELERVGDLAKNIAKRAGVLEGFARRDVLKGIDRMGRAVTAQLSGVLDAFRNRDPARATKFWISDEDVDQLYNSYFREVLTYMIEDPRTIGDCAHILFMAKNLERIGDHATNIAEMIYFSVTGDYLSADDRPKADELPSPMDEGTPL
ncbi:MAG: phosphate signaling complex protein PhoU [Pseudomonadota bacterium]